MRRRRCCPELVGEAPDVRHADGRADGRENKAPTAGKMLGVFGLFHLFSALPVGQVPFLFIKRKKRSGEKPDRFNTLYRLHCKTFKHESQGEPVFVQNVRKNGA